MLAKPIRTRLGALIVLIAAVGLSACEGAHYREQEDTVRKGGHSGPVFKDEYKKETIFGSGGLNFGGKETKEEGGSGGLGVNSFLWRATLDTISFMPINSADPFGGVIITDWHTQPESPSERFKLNIYILGRALRADGVKVAVFRQVATAGNWIDATVPTETASKIEEAILMRARQLRNETLSQ